MGARARETSTNDTFAVRLRNTRLAANDRQADVARELGVQTRTIGTWERGIARPGPGHFAALARYLQLTGPSDVIDLLEGKRLASVVSLHGSPDGEPPEPRLEFELSPSLRIFQAHWERVAAASANRKLSEAENQGLANFMLNLSRIQRTDDGV